MNMRTAVTANPDFAGLFGWLMVPKWPRGKVRECSERSVAHLGAIFGAIFVRLGAPGKLPEVLEDGVTGGLQSSHRNHTPVFSLILTVRHI